MIAIDLNTGEGQGSLYSETSQRIVNSEITGNSVSNGINPQTGEKLADPAFRFARKDKEVLIEGDIPPEAYRVISND